MSDRSASTRCNPPLRAAVALCLVTPPHAHAASPSPGTLSRRQPRPRSLTALHKAPRRGVHSRNPHHHPCCPTALPTHLLALVSAVDRAAGTADRHSPDVHLSASRVAEQSFISDPRLLVAESQNAPPGWRGSYTGTQCLFAHARAPCSSIDRALKMSDLLTRDETNLLQRGELLPRLERLVKHQEQARPDACEHHDGAD